MDFTGLDVLCPEELCVPDLRADIQDLYQLRTLRERAIRLRDQGAAALADPSVDAVLKELNPDDPAVREKHKWISMQSVLEWALLVKVERMTGALAPHAWRPTDREVSLLKYAAKQTLPDLFPPFGDPLTRPMDRRIPVLLSALALQVLARRASTVLSREAMIFYYRILFEFNVATRPDWTIGAARSGDGGNASAFVTSECAKAILAFEQSFTLAVQFFEQTRELCEQYHAVAGIHGSAGISDNDNPSLEPHPITLWTSRAIARIWLDWYISTAAARSEGAFDLELTVDQHATLKDVGAFVSTLPAVLGTALSKAATTISDAHEEIKRHNDAIYGAYLKDDPGAPTPSAVPGQGLPRRRESAASVRAINVIKRAWDEASRGARLCFEEKECTTLLKKLSDQFRQVSRDIRRVLDPSRHYLEIVLDRELAASEASETDSGEIAFAALTFGSISGWTQGRGRLHNACNLLAAMMPPGGLLSSRRPFHSTDRGYKLFPTGCEIVRSVASLFEQMSFEFSPTFVRRFVEGLREKAIETVPGKHIGWNFEGATDFDRPSVWVTAVTVLALEKIVRLLDNRINNIVFRHFTVLAPEKLHRDLDLNGLIYPDYGFSAYYDRPEADIPIAIRLEEMRAHLAGIPLTRPQGHGDRTLYSAVLYGPPGTGKTTFAEALAVSSGVPLITLSPFDLRTEDQPIEGRTRLVFEALSMLTRVVILFDEFEKVLAERNPRQSGKMSKSDNKPTDSTQFLLTGLLPQLAQLHEVAERQAIVYFMATNHLTDVDEAAIRRGRFDIWFPVNFPDPLSRAGTFFYRLQRLRRRLGGDRERQLTLSEIERLLESVAKSRYLPASTLAEVLFRLPKWVTNAELDIPQAAMESDAFEYLIAPSETELPKAKKMQPLTAEDEAVLEAQVAMATTRSVEDEHREEIWLRAVEKALENRLSDLTRLNPSPEEALRFCLAAAKRRGP
jgi:hypothetical protein